MDKSTVYNFDALPAAPARCLCPGSGRHTRLHMSQSAGLAEGGYGRACDESASFCEPCNKPDAAADELSAAIEDIVTRVRLAHGTEASGDLISSAVQICGGPGVVVDGLLPLPVNAHVFASLQPLGGNESAIYPPRLAFDNAAWQGGGVPAHFLDAVTRDFGIPTGSVDASLRGLLVTGPGGDLAHRICEPNAPGVCLARRMPHSS